MTGRLVERILRGLARRRGYALVRRGDEDLVYLHQYAGGYAEYRETQIATNRRKIDQVWADEATLGAVAADLRRRHPEGVRSGICHGARNGFEVAWLREALGAEVLGTDISDTATQFAHMVVWDFHEENPDWVGRFDFVYTNSLDQAAEPDRALRTWARQLAPGGRIYIEHTTSHGVGGASAKDPFGAHPFVMPYLFLIWGKGAYRLEEVIEIAAKTNKPTRAWIFVLAAAGAP